MKTDYSHDPDTTVSYCPFFPLKKGKLGAHFLDANLIQVVPKRRDTAAGLPICIVSLLAEISTFRSDKGVREKDARGWSSLTDLCPTHGVVPCNCLVGVTPLRNKGHTFFSKPWA
jgi:hypothetical protein